MPGGPLPRLWWPGRHLFRATFVRPLGPPVCCFTTRCLPHAMPFLPCPPRRRVVWEDVTMLPYHTRRHSQDCLLHAVQPPQGRHSCSIHPLGGRAGQVRWQPSLQAAGGQWDRRRTSAFLPPTYSGRAAHETSSTSPTAWRTTAQKGGGRTCRSPRHMGRMKGAVAHGRAHGMYAAWA